jgi:hypothetical protein
VANTGVIRIESERSSGVAGFGDAHQVTNSGTIRAHGNFSGGMQTTGVPILGSAGLDLEMFNTGRITTDGDLGIGIALGISFGGKIDGFGVAEGGSIVNSGVIETEGDGAAGIAMNGNGHHLVNSGRITADGGEFDGDPVGLFRAAGVVVTGDDALVENTRSGVIVSKNAVSAAVELNIIEQDGLPTEDMSASLENRGLIKGADIAILGGDGEETVINHGRIVGDVVLGGGGDTFVSGKGGSLAGALLLGDGDDIVFIEDGSGKTRIADFEAGIGGGDVIDVSAFFGNFDELLTKSHQSNGDVLIVLDGNDRLVLQNTQLGALVADDFQFAST